MKLILSFLIVLGHFLVAVETGVLNVFTDLPKALIKVDGLIVAEESVVKLPVEVGEHYVQVLLDEELVYAEKVIVKKNRSTTVVSEHFVDIITKTPSRGAIDREVERLRKSRGNIGLGFISNTKLQSQLISMKWWAHKHFGAQALVGGSRDGSNEKGLVGGRLFVSPSEKIYSDQVLSGKVFVGLGQKTTGNQTQHISQTYSEFGIVVEAFVGQVVKEFMDARYSSGFFYERSTTTRTTKDGETVEEETTDSNTGEVIRDLMIVVLTQIGHVSGELTTVKLPNQPAEQTVGVGIHFYF